MSDLFLSVRTRIDRSERARMALLSGVSFVLGLAFIGFLVSDQAHAAGL